MAKVSKTNPFRPKGQTESRSHTQGEKKDEENRSSSSGTTSVTNPEEDTQDKKQEKAKGKRPMQAKRGNQKPTLYERMIGPERSKGSVVKRGRGKPEAYTLRLWSKHNLGKPRRGINAHRARGNVAKRGRGKTAGYTLGLWSKHNLRQPRKETNVHVSSELQPNEKEQEDEDVFQDSERDLEEVCNRTKIERRNDDDTDGGGAGTHRNLTNFGIRIVAK